VRMRRFQRLFSPDPYPRLFFGRNSRIAKQITTEIPQPARKNALSSAEGGKPMARTTGATELRRVVHIMSGMAGAIRSDAGRRQVRHRAGETAGGQCCVRTDVRQSPSCRSTPPKTRLQFLVCWDLCVIVQRKIA